MPTYIRQRLGMMLLTLWAIVTLTFFLMHAVPGGTFVSERMLAPEDRAGFRQACLDVANVASFLNSLAGAFSHGAETGRDVQLLFQLDHPKTNVIPFPKQPEVPQEEPVEPPACFRPLPDTMPPDVRAELERLIAYIERDGKPVA